MEGEKWNISRYFGANIGKNKASIPKLSFFNQKMCRNIDEKI